MHKKSWKSLFEKIEKITILLIFAHFASSKKNPFLHFFVKIQKVRLDFPNIFPKNVIFFFSYRLLVPIKRKKIFMVISHILEKWSSNSWKKTISPFFRTRLESLPNIKGSTKKIVCIVFLCDLTDLWAFCYGGKIYMKKNHFSKNRWKRK